MTGSGIGAVTVGSSIEPVATAWETSAIASNSPRSEGLTGAASTRTSTSRSPGRGVSTVRTESRSSRSGVTKLRSWRMFAGISGTVAPSLEVDSSAAYSATLHVLRLAVPSVRSQGPDREG